MNTEAWDEFIKLEEEADSILVGPSTAGRVGKYVSKRQRLKAPAAKAPAKEVARGRSARVWPPIEELPVETLQEQVVSIVTSTISIHPARIRFTLPDRKEGVIKLSQEDKQAILATLAKPVVAAADATQFTIKIKADPKAGKRKKAKRKAYR